MVAEKQKSDRDLGLTIRELKRRIQSQHLHGLSHTINSWMGRIKSLHEKGDIQEAEKYINKLHSLLFRLWKVANDNNHLLFCPACDNLVKFQADYNKRGFYGCPQIICVNCKGELNDYWETRERYKKYEDLIKRLQRKRLQNGMNKGEKL